GDSTSSFRASFGHSQDQADSFSQSLPAGGFGLELFPALSSQAIELSLSAGLGLVPVSSEESAVFQPVQGGIERALWNLHYIARNLLKPLRYRIPMHRSQRDDFQNQQIQSALRQIVLFRHPLPLSIARPGHWITRPASFSPIPRTSAYMYQKTCRSARGRSV